MDNQQPSFYVYVSCDCKGRKYIGYHKGLKDDNYLGSFSDKTFEPTHKLIISDHSTKEVALLMERAYQKAWNVHKHNPDWVNRATCNFEGNVEAYGRGNRKGFKHSEESIRKIREARKRQGSNVWNKGMDFPNGYHTEETKRKISQNSASNRPEVKLKRALTQSKRIAETGFHGTQKCKPETVEKHKKKVQRLEAELRTLQANGSGNARENDIVRTSTEM